MTYGMDTIKMNEKIMLDIILDEKTKEQLENEMIDICDNEIGYQRCEQKYEMFFDFLQELQCHLMSNGEKEAFEDPYSIFAEIGISNYLDQIIPTECKIYLKEKYLLFNTKANNNFKVRIDFTKLSIVKKEV